MIGDALPVRGIQVEDIIGPKEGKVHVLTAFARVDGSQVTYPAPTDTPGQLNPVTRSEQSKPPYTNHPVFLLGVRAGTGYRLRTELALPD
jgi:hypothetical protein